MYVYSVKKGDTTATVAKTHFIREQELRQINGLTSSKLTPGLNLIIPGKPSTLVHHTVGAGESLTSIARQYDVTVAAVAGTNGLSDHAKLEMGQILFVPVPMKTKREIEVNGYLIPSGTSADRSTVATSGQLTYATIFSYHANFKGDLIPLSANDALSALDQHGVLPLLSVTNYDGTTFSPDLAHTIIHSSDLSTKLFESIEKSLEKETYRGVNIDFEHLQPDDRSAYNAFIQKLADRMHQKGYSVSIAVGPKTKNEPNAAWMGAFDYETLGSLVDFIMLMTYEWGWVGGPPMAIAPLNQVRAVLEYAISVIPREKILMGIPTYGYDWDIPDTKNNLATGISPLGAQNLAIDNEATIRFDIMSASPMFRYRVGDQEHEVWYEDAKSILAKFHLVYDMQLRGISFWVLGQPFPQLYDLVTETFHVKK